MAVLFAWRRAVGASACAVPQRWRFGHRQCLLRSYLIDLTTREDARGGGRAHLIQRKNDLSELCPPNCRHRVRVPAYGRWLRVRLMEALTTAEGELRARHKTMRGGRGGPAALWYMRKYLDTVPGVADMATDELVRIVRGCKARDGGPAARLPAMEQPLRRSIMRVLEDYVINGTAEFFEELLSLDEKLFPVTPASPEVCDCNRSTSRVTFALRGRAPWPYPATRTLPALSRVRYVGRRTSHRRTSHRPMGARICARTQTGSRSWCSRNSSPPHPVVQARTRARCARRSSPSGRSTVSFVPSATRPTEAPCSPSLVLRTGQPSIP